MYYPNFDALLRSCGYLVKLCFDLAQMTVDAKSNGGIHQPIEKPSMTATKCWHFTLLPMLKAGVFSTFKGSDHYESKANH